MLLFVLICIIKIYYLKLKINLKIYIIEIILKFFFLLLKLNSIK